MRDRAGFEQGRRRDDQGRPLKLQIGGGTSKGYAANYDQIDWGKKEKPSEEKQDGE